MKLTSSMLLLSLFLCQVSFAQGPARFDISISKTHASPKDTVVPAQQPIELVVYNSGKSQTVFRSSSLNSEVIISPNSSATINLGTLRPGVYYFSGEFKSGSVHGRILVKK